MPATTTDKPPVGEHTPQRKVRVPDGEWHRFLANAKARGTTGSAILLERVRSYNADCEANPIEPS